MQTNYDQTITSRRHTELSLAYSCVDTSAHVEDAVYVVDGNAPYFAVYEYACCAHHEARLSLPSGLCPWTLQVLRLTYLFHHPALSSQALM